jgi:glycosyltransferase involved in cell wall biosynthesis
MKLENPRVSVVIPAYNQAQYLEEAISSALGQTYTDFEVIVVDDGSSDDTAAVARKFKPAIRYIWHENQGLAGARNTGIRQARGRFIALLDSDDAWCSSFLASMMALIEERPQAAVYYCGVIYMDSAGRDLPQIGKVKIMPADALYQSLLRANFLIPSTIVLRRSVVAAAGLFDVTFRRLQDRELWLRLLRQGYTFAGLDEPLVRYRVHNASLSNDTRSGQAAALAVVEKHFGPDDGQYQNWHADKRRAYGGVYRYHAVTTSLSREGDWQRCAHYLSQAFRVDPTLALDLDLFYELALGAQPVGYRGALANLDIENNANELITLLERVWPSIPILERQGLRSQAYGTAYYALSLIAYSQVHFALCRRFLVKALGFRSELWRDKRVVGALIKSFVGPSAVGQMRWLVQRMQGAIRA